MVDQELDHLEMTLSEGSHQTRDLAVVLRVHIRAVVYQQPHYIQVTTLRREGGVREREGRGEERGREGAREGWRERREGGREGGRELGGRVGRKREYIYTYM